MKRTILAAALAAPLALTGCTTGSIPNIIPMPYEIQAACAIIALAVPVAETFRNNMTVAQQALLTSAEAAVTDCAAGNATAAVLDVAKGIQAYLFGKGVTRAMLLQRAAAPR